MEKKNICIITQCSLPIPTTKGGAVETLVEYILTENEKFNKYHFTVISIVDNKAEILSKQFKNVEFIYVKKGNDLLNKLLFQTYRVLKHLNVYIPFSLEFKKCLKILKKIENQDIFIYEAGPTTQLPALNKIISKDKLLVHIHWDGMGNKRKDNSFSYLIPVSNYIGEQWRKNTGCSKSKIKPLYNCANIERFEKQISEEEKKELKKKLGIPDENKIILFTGRIVEEKGVKELLQAFHQVKYDNITLLIVGSANFGSKTNTPYEKEVAEIIQKSSRQIIFTGFVHQTKLYKYYNIADIAVMPSLFQDPAPLVCIETQATGTPLIATRVGGIPEYVTKKSAILVNKDQNIVTSLADKIEYLLENPEIMEDMGKEAKKNVKKYNTGMYYKQFCELIDGILINGKEKLK